MTTAPLTLSFPGPLQCLFVPKRFKVLWGGRGAGRSWGCARALLVKGRASAIRVLCVREFQNSIDDSVHKVLKDQIQLLGWDNFYDVQKTRIIGANGTEFNFEGIKNNVNRIKSYEGIDICWVEEGAKTSKNSMGVLVPTIRKESSEIWITFNPELETDYIYQRFIKDSSLAPVASNRFQEALGSASMLESESSFVCKMTYAHNPWFPQVLREEMLRDKARDYDHYLNIWEGFCVQILEGVIFSKELRRAQEENRICSVPWERTIPVDTYWDLGRADATAIWFVQRAAMQIRVLEYYEATGQELEHYLGELQKRKYLYGIHVLPHDAEHKVLGRRKTIKEQVNSHYPGKVRIAKKLQLVDQINMGRTIFPHCFFDEDKCEDGLNALRHYRYKVLEERDGKGRLAERPLHDWASHGGSAFQTMAVSIRDPDFDQGSAASVLEKLSRSVESRWREIVPNLGWLGQ